MLSPQTCHDYCQLELAVYSVKPPQVAEALLTLPENAFTDQQRAVLAQLSQRFNGNGAQLNSDSPSSRGVAPRGDGKESPFASSKISKRGPGCPPEISGGPPQSPGSSDSRGAVMRINRLQLSNDLIHHLQVNPQRDPSLFLHTPTIPPPFQPSQDYELIDVLVLGYLSMQSYRGAPGYLPLYLSSQGPRRGRL